MEKRLAADRQVASLIRWLVLMYVAPYRSPIDRLAENAASRPDVTFGPRNAGQMSDGRHKAGT
jgi:hypothetical protein